MKKFEEFYEIVKAKYPEINERAESIIKESLSNTEGDDIPNTLENSSVFLKLMLILEEYHNWLER